MRTLFAREKDDRFYLSFFKEFDKPKRVFETKDELEQEIQRRGCQVEWLDASKQ